ncbi:MAG: hypothetical protein NC191_07075 [Muribaculaceae bacterium]|nr:hypothetical protein [Muribaculaceae bacterium]
MKKTLLSLMILVPLFTGCTNINTDITINDNKSAEVVTELTYFGNLNEARDANAAFIMNNYQTFLDNKYKVDTDFSADKSVIKANKKTVNLDVQDLDLSSLGFSSNLESGKFIELKRNFLISSYNIDLTYDYNKVKENLMLAKADKSETKKPELTPEYFNKYAAQSNVDSADDTFQENLDDDTKEFNIKSLNEAAENNITSDKDIFAEINIKVPAFASSNNADSSAGNVYTWNVNKNKPTEIKLQYVRYSGFAILFVLVLGIGLLTFMTRKILRHETQKRIDNIDNIV